MQRALVVSVLAACAGSTTSPPQALDAATRRARYETIREVAAQMGVHAGALFAGIAISETGLAHCWSEARWACQGPSSPSCDDGPVIAGAADGPCAAREGGLGMFQFDAGTHADTLRVYGEQILSVEGSTAQAVSFVIDKVEADVLGEVDWFAAAAWIDSVPLRAGDAKLDAWAALLACRYNGCCAATATCAARARGYRDNALAAVADTGAEFWRTDDRCTALPADGVITVRGDCYVAAGDPRHWRREHAGYANALEWTRTTASAAPHSFARWLVRTGGAGRYRVEVHLDGGAFGRARAARYDVHHAGVVDAVTIDQTSAIGFTPLGDFAFAGTADERVELGDDGGDAATAGTPLAFDAIRVTALADDRGGERASATRGGCRSAHALGTAAIAVGVLGVIGRRRRRRGRRRS